jgi:hypothetical protein
MSELTKEEISRLDQELDDHIRLLPLLSRPRTTAIVHLLLYFDDLINSLPDHAQGLASAGFDAMEFAIQWIFKFCPDTTEREHTRHDPDVYREAKGLHSAAQSYSEIWYIMSMLHNRHATAARENDGTIRVRVGSDRYIPRDIAARWLRPTMSAKANEAIAHAKASFDLSRFLEETHARVVSKGQVAYDPRPVYPSFVESQKAILRHAWDLDESWDVGGYTIEDFRKAWVALTSLAWIRHYACYVFQSSAEKGLAPVTLRTTKRRINELTEYSGVRRDRASLILHDLTYNPSETRSNPVHQPFLPVAVELLAFTSWMLLIADCERNLTKIIQVLRPSIWSALKNRKESKWLEELQPQLAALNWRTVPGVEFEHDGQRSQIDLVVIDAEQRFVVALELKWLTGPDTAGEMRVFEGEIEKGIKQARLAAQWLNSRTELVARRLSIASSEIAGFTFESLVLTRPAFGSGRIHVPNVPVINLELLTLIIAAVGSDLRLLWTIADQGNFLPREGEHFATLDVPHSFGRLRFVAEKFGSTTLAKWDPAIELQSEVERHQPQR